ncbi:MAG: ribosome maturation factor RimP, partial [Sandaracinaceae bacterium]|nr:ribosome maturation factor RimP [Sandaracinaceae bacterium]
ESPNLSSERSERIVTNPRLSSPFPRSHVTLADCQAVSRDISALLDVHEELAPQGAYRLEVTSPGVDRPLVRLKDFQRFCGAEVRVFTKEPLEGTKRRIQGVLERVEDGRITVAVADANGTQRWDIELENIEKAHVVYRFE